MKTKKTRTDCRIIIVEDQLLMFNLLKKILRAGGYKKIAFAKTGLEALNIVKKNMLDFIISDWYMPNMSGIELLKIIRDNPLFCNLPFVMITGEMLKDHITYAFEEGVDDYLIKPVSQDKVLQVIDKILFEDVDPTSARYTRKKILQLKQQKKYHEALALARKVLKNGEDTNIYLIVSECYLGLKEFKTAKMYAKKVLAHRRDSRAAYMLARITLAEKKYKEALNHLREACEINPLNVGRKIELGDAYIRMGKADDGVAVFEGLKKSEMTDLNNISIGAAYLNSYGDYKRASRYLDKVSTPIPETIPVFNKYAIELNKHGECEKAILQYKKCLKLDPENPKLQYNIASAYYKMKKNDLAQAVLEDTLKKNPEFPKARQLLEYIKGKKFSPAATIKSERHKPTLDDCKPAAKVAVGQNLPIRD